MAAINLHNVNKTYGTEVGLKNISLSVQNKEFLVLFGPAGAGKTTMLNVIAGITEAESGNVSFNGKNIDAQEPGERNVAMVFENYALYPHMTIYDNIASPLRSPLHKQAESYIKTAVVQLAETMNIAHILDRFPRQVSNGQRQRTALGRALIRNPNVFLMDEPLAHLDVKMRNHMRTELKSIQQNLNTTVIYATHDYLEAMSLGDRVAIINEGSIVQVGTPQEVFYTPKNIFTAKLLGEPEITLLSGELVVDTQGTVKFKTDSVEFTVPKEDAKYLQQYFLGQIIVGVRSVDIYFSLEKKAEYLSGEVEDLYSIGSKTVVNVRCKTHVFNVLVSNDTPVSIGEVVFLQPQPDNFIFFDYKSHSFIYRNTRTFDA